jgi:SprT-like family
MELQKLFVLLNKKYFGGRLPGCRVIRSTALGSGAVYRPEKREIQLPDRLKASALRKALLHQMAHVATTGDHGPSWREEMYRLIDLGAPLERELDVCVDILRSPWPRCRKSNNSAVTPQVNASPPDRPSSIERFSPDILCFLTRLQWVSDQEVRTEEAGASKGWPS